MSEKGATRTVAWHVADIRARGRFDVEAVVVSTGILRVGPSASFRVTVREGDAELDLIFLGRLYVPGLEPGRYCIVAGRAAGRAGRVVVWNPRYYLLAEPLDEERLNALRQLQADAYLRPPPARKAPAVCAGAAPDAGTTLDGESTDVEPTGRFRIYLGPAAGVGKTYAMLDEARRRKERGKDVVVAVVETHGRPATEAQLADLEVIAPKIVTHRGSSFREMDLDAVLARRPDIAVVDELAHTNVPGSGRNDKRWQDVLELLAADISVITTVNVQHIESLADIAERISGVTIRERVPDAVLQRADQIELVDSSPEQLRRRMLHGNIYPPARARHALQSFFRTDTLAALRELTLRFVADEVDDDLLEGLAASSSASLDVAERVLVGVSPAPGADAVLRRAARIAARLKADVYAVHVQHADVAEPDAQGLAELHRLADDLGAIWVDLSGDPVSAIIDFATQRQVTQIVVGRSQRSRWQQLTGGGSTVRRLTRRAMACSIDMHIVARDKPLASPAGGDGRATEHA